MSKPKGTKTKNPNAKKTGPRGWTLTQQEKLKADIQRLDGQGYNQYQIAEHLGVSQALVSLRLKEIQQDYQDAYIDNRKMWVMRELNVLMDLRRRAFEEIALLKERGKRKKVSKSGTSGESGYSEDTESVEDPETLGWHKLVLETVQETAELMGLKELPSQVFNVLVNNGPQQNMFKQLLDAMLEADGVQPAITNGDGPVIDVTPTPG